jgi:putative flippase GtrA
MNQFTRFLAVGVINTICGYAVIFACMYLAMMTPETSNAAGYAVGLVVSYVLNRNFTFKSKQSRCSEIIRFLSVFAVAYVTNFAVLLILIHKINMHKGVSQILAGGFYIVVSFIMNKYYVFRTINNI